MQELLNAISELVCLVSTEKVTAIASRIRLSEPTKVAFILSSMFGTPIASRAVERLIKAWQSSPVSNVELASMLLSASHMLTKVSSEQSMELVWTGPTTPFVSARRTEQALLEVINGANHVLIITSFVAYNVSSIVSALNSASDRGVRLSMLLESSQDHGGSINIDVIDKMRNLVPRAKLYAWLNKSEAFVDGRVHAKIAVADGYTCFITSANLTGYAMEKNIEVGVLISGGELPRQLDNHIRSLIETNVIAQV